MKENKEISIVDEMNKEAEEILRKIEKDESLRGIEVTPEMDERMNARIRAVEEERAQKHKIRKFPKKMLIALVAVFVLLFAFSMTSVGSKSYLKEMWEKRFGNQEVEVTSVADMESSETKEDDETAVYEEIEKKIGVNAIQLGYLPQKMIIDSHEIDEEQRMARILYLYQGETIRYSIYANDNDSFLVNSVEDELLDSFKVTTDEQEIVVEEYKVEGEEQNRYIANFKNDGVEYQLKGIMRRSDFEEILKNLKYF